VPTKSATPKKKRASKTARPRRQDAIALLKQDHREVEKLFKQFEKAGDGAEREKRRIADSIIGALSQHAAVEEEIVYPWARDYIEGADDMVLEAIEEHRVVKWLLTEIAVMPPSDERFDAKVTVLAESVRHHVKEEETDLFPDLRTVATRTELLELGDAIRAAKPHAPTHPELDGPLGVAVSVGSAVEHARDVGRDVVDRVESLAGLD
jgi:hemerythrin superfamily protein